MTKEPPKIARWLLKQFDGNHRHEALLGDLTERFRQDQSSAWFWQQTIAVVIDGIWTRLLATGRLAMKYKTAWVLSLAGVAGFGLWTGMVPSQHTEVAKIATIPSIPSVNPVALPMQREAKGTTSAKNGYSKTPIARILPVAYEIQKPSATTAMVVVIDVSGSMSVGQLTIAKEAARSTLKTLKDSDHFGVLAINSGYVWAAPLQLAGNRDGINAQIETMYAGGGTDLYVGLNAAYDALKGESDEVKTVLLLSDGITQVADFHGLMTNMLSAGIHVSSVAVGRASNRELMADIALWGRGRAYYIDSYDRVPQIFTRETESVLSKTP